MLAHYEVVIRDNTFLQKLPWQCLIVDEGHRLKNSSSVLYRQLKELRVPFSLLLTGTPVQNNLTELYSLLSFVAPDVFPESRLEAFVQHYNDVTDQSVASALHSVVEPFLLRRVKSEVMEDLPAKTEVVLYTGLSSMQKNYYKAILTKDLSAFGEGGSKTRLMNILTQLRKCVNHPYLFDGAEPETFQLGEHLVTTSGKLYVIDKLLNHLKQRGHRVLMFSQMTRMLDIIQDYLGYRGYSYERLDGSVRGEERFLAVRNFSEDEQTFVFLLSTRAGGQGLNLVGADTVVIVDSDFNPQNDLQAAARAHRIGQTRPVKVIRLVTRHSVEEMVLKRAMAKLQMTSTVIEGGQFTHGTVSSSSVATDSARLSDILKFGLDTLLGSEESSIVDEDFERILGRQ
ncbi:Chromodomain-helicase-DNA-binding protein 1-like [Geodia barretti]|nr:Chromodomain-helicase-DNA-binding protein 1-like [Geodia barretti]